jgi:hypothetical protein
MNIYKAGTFRAYFSVTRSDVVVEKLTRVALLWYNILLKRV